MTDEKKPTFVYQGDGWRKKVECEVRDGSIIVPATTVPFPYTEKEMSADELKDCENFEPWTLQDAICAFEVLKHLFRYQGWILTMYGSVLNRFSPIQEYGDQPTATYYAALHKMQTLHKDLDLMAVPFTPDANPPGSMVAMLIKELNYKQMGQRYFGVMDTESYQLIMPSNHLIDLQFRQVSVTK